MQEVTCVRQKADPKQIPKLLSHTEEAVLKESGAPHSATRTCDGELAEPTKHMTHMGLDEPILVPPEEPLLAQNTEDLEQSQVELERIDQQLDQPVMVTCINEGPQLEGVAPPQNDFSEPLKTVSDICTCIECALGVSRSCMQHNVHVVTCTYT